MLAGVKLVFLKSGFEYARGFDDEDDEDEGSKGRGGTTARGDAKADDGAADASRGTPPARGQPDGAIRLVAEGLPVPRVRAMRWDMTDGVVVKETSEAIILRRLQADLPAEFK